MTLVVMVRGFLAKLENAWSKIGLCWDPYYVIILSPAVQSLGRFLFGCLRMYIIFQENVEYHLLNEI